MLRTFTSLLVASLLLTGVTNTTADDSPNKSPSDKYAALVADFEKQGGARQFAPQFLELAAAHATDPVAVDSLVWIVKNVRGRPESTKALELLAKDHLQSEKLGPACKLIAREPSTAAEKFLRTLMDKSRHADVQAQACLSLATLLQQQATVVEQLRKQPELADRILQYYGPDYGRHLSSLKADTLTAQIEKVYEQMRESFGSVPLDDSTMGQFADKALFRIRRLSVGRPAPEIEGQDVDGKRFKLSDYRGQVVVLSFWGHW